MSILLKSLQYTNLSSQGVFVTGAPTVCFVLFCYSSKTLTVYRKNCSKHSTLIIITFLKSLDVTQLPPYFQNEGFLGTLKARTLSQTNNVNDFS